MTLLAPPTVTTTSLPVGTIGVPYASSLDATGGLAPYSWSITAGTLPAGLQLTPGGTISGTPTLSGDYSVTVTVTDANQLTGSADLSSGHRSSRTSRLLGSGQRRRHLQLRRRSVLRLHRRPPLERADRRAWRRRPTVPATGCWPPTAGSSPSATPSSMARPAACTSMRPIVAMAPTPDGAGLLAGRLGRRHLLLRRCRLLRVHRRTASSTSPSSGWHPPPTATGTGSSPPMAACSRSATPTSTARPVVCRSRSRSWA